MQDQSIKIIMDDLQGGRFNVPQQKGDFRIVAGGRSYAVTRMWKTGFALEEHEGAGLRGLVEVYQGDTYLLMGLVVANPPADGEISFEFKRATAVTDRPPLDFAAFGDMPSDVAAQDGLAL